MKKEDKKKVLESLLLQLEQKEIQSEIDYRVWTAEALTKSSEANLSAQTKAKGMQELIQKQIVKTKELLDELEK